jgi:hypothetical protein
MVTAHSVTTKPRLECRIGNGPNSYSGGNSSALRLLLKHATIAQAVSRRPPTAAARVRAQVRSCGICGGQSDTGAGFLRVLRFPILIPPTSHRGGPGSSPGQVMWDLWRTKWHWGRFSPSTSVPNSLSTDLPPRRPRFEPRSGHVGFVADKVALGQVFSEYFGFPFQFSFHRLLHTRHLSSGAGTVGQLVADVPSGLSLTTPQETN